MAKREDAPSIPKLVLGNLAIAALYFAGAWAAEVHPLLSGTLSLVWVPAGLAWAAVLIGGWRMLPGVAIGAGAAGYWTGSSDFAIAVQVLGATLGAFAGAFLLRYLLSFDDRMARASDVLAFTGVTITVPFLTGGIAVGALALDGRIPDAGVVSAWIEAWVGRAMSVLLFVPLALAAANAWKGSTTGVFGAPRSTGSRLREGALLYAGTLIVAASVWTGQLPAEFAAVAIFAAIPLVAWSGQRFGPGMVATLTLILAVFGVIGTLGLHGPFVGGAGEGLYALYAFVGVSSITGYALAGLVGERESEAKAKRATERRFRDIVESSPDVLLSVDRKGRIMFCNRSGPGWMRPAPGRSTVFDLVADEDRQPLKDRLDLVFVNGVVTRIDVRAVGTDTIPRHFSLQLAPIRRVERIDAAMVMAHDITEQRQAEARLKASEARVQAFFDRSPTPIAMLDGDGRFLQTNNAARELLDAKEVDLSGFSVVDILAPDEREHAIDWLQEMHLGQRNRVHAKTIVRTAKGEPVDVRLTLAAVRDDGPTSGFLVAIFEDIRAAQRAEKAEALAMSRQEEIGQLEEVSAWKSQLLNIASHEIRNPLTPMKLQMEMLASGLYGPLTEKQAQTVTRLQRESDRLANLVTGILDVARIETGKVALDPRPVAAGDIVAEVADSFEEASREWGVTLGIEMPQPLTLQADPDRLKQVVFNLLSNAFKFTPEGGRVTISCHADGDHARIAVNDTGPGLTQEQIDRLFQAFSQVHDTRGGDKKKGIGLGLYISKGIVEAHGGTIDVESDGPGEGSTFSFRVPLARADAASADVSSQVDALTGNVEGSQG